MYDSRTSVDELVS